MLVFFYVFVKGDEVFSDVARVLICTAIDYVSGCALAVRNV